MKNPQFVSGNYYHVYNHAVEGCNMVRSTFDSDRFVECMVAFNRVNTIESIQLLKKKFGKMKIEPSDEPLVAIIAYCCNPNHYHLLLEQLVDDGIVRFMQRSGTGFTNYLNTKYQRQGSIFRGRYKAVHVSTNEQLLHTSVYVGLNDRVHNITGTNAKLVRSSWEEYEKEMAGLCSKSIILDQFRDTQDYLGFAKESLELSWQAKMDQKILKQMGAN
ncbi:MAG: hypothetical protein COV07_01075 [Candidatus Vogelbacteria bacterium CG10_big_fil_rev_8_21_14_0_10_45_14]|uniref:Transposase IS200-like domain-containing protein n=1 Tax=Candidatus Vogelbacteria bacterium CG10_big_fil_rev_8_21_14_0_10_45_14 TaxID=1975042 RepID=A0A2H0RKI8_9BACT|nr:MAG: hypothetical protein COV07_01075 [Candidatus Vogelbacteria bacterium CG10_big_fil_rev_8_21_14_0_10_45_14]